MTLGPATPFHLLCLGMLRCASLLVPRVQRGEWWREWYSELWHVRRERAPERGISWSGEREIAAFCRGAFEDALSLRRHQVPRRVPLATTMGSATQCILFLAGVLAVSCGVAGLLPGVFGAIQPPHYRDVGHLMLIQDGSSFEDSVATVSPAQFQVWKQKRQSLFEGFTFYKVVKGTVSGAAHARAELGIADASSNLFELLGLPLRLTSDDAEAQDGLPRVILSDAVWRREFGSDPRIVGRKVQVGSRAAVVGGVAPRGAWRLPGKVDVWLLEPEGDAVQGGVGFVVGRLVPSKSKAIWAPGGRWTMTARTPEGVASNWLCTSLTDRSHTPWGIFVFTVLLACLALPATTSLPLGDYPSSSRKISWSMRLRRWRFLGGKLALLLPIVYFISLDLAYMRVTMDPVSSEYIQIVASFSICLFGLRWALRDQRQRCPMCLGKLTHPARVGEPSRNFLTWNGTELICVGGHGLLHIPEMPTSWFSTQRWLYLDSSWEGLFPEPTLVPAGDL